MLTEERIKRWIRSVRSGRQSAGSLVEELRLMPYERLTHAHLDTHRRLRRGIPEVILAEGKTPKQLLDIVRRMRLARETILITRLCPEAAKQLKDAFPSLHYDPMAKIAWRHAAKPPQRKGAALVVTGGTSDVPVAEEAACTLEILGSRAVRLVDVGVAGVHRLLNQWSLLQRARVIVVVAGMEGALASVVAGLVRCPVIAVPTSVGYGASFAGLAPLLTMMNSCVPGIGVVNIDNGFGAGYLAHLINNASQASNRKRRQ